MKLGGFLLCFYRELLKLKITKKFPINVGIRFHNIYNRNSMNIFDRTKLLIGEEALQALKNKRVAVFGVGGVGGYATEALARSGIGTLDLIDKDVVDETNINRQIIALQSTIGQPKVEVAKERCLDINPEMIVNTHQVFYLPETADQFNFKDYDYVVDAIDTVTGKLQLIEAAKEANVPVISSMGAGNKLNPTEFEVADISETSVCPLAKVMRKELRDRGIDHLKVVYSKEPPIKVNQQTPGSIAFVPSVVGLIIASEVIKDLIK